MFTGDELSTLEMDVHKYPYLISKDCCLSIYNEIVEMRTMRSVVLKKLNFRVKEAKKAWEVERKMCVRSPRV